MQKFSFGELAGIIGRREGDFEDMGVVVTMGTGEGSTYTFQDNGSDVLGVAHVDTVLAQGWASLIRVRGERVVISPRLDDRLGVYIITKLLPALGVTCDWLLTTGEECGRSSAEWFTPGKEYNWAFSFDRRGTDAVLYQHDHKALRKVLKRGGFKIGHGSFSDLSVLEAGCSGINFGCGYQEEHSPGSYAVLSDTFLMVHKFVRFFKQHCRQRLPYQTRSRGNWGRPYWKEHWPYGSNGGYPSSREDDWTKPLRPIHTRPWYASGETTGIGAGFHGFSGGRNAEYLTWYDPQDPDNPTVDVEVLEEYEDNCGKKIPVTKDNGK